MTTLLTIALISAVGGLIVSGFVFFLFHEESGQLFKN